MGGREGEGGQLFECVTEWAPQTCSLVAASAAGAALSTASVALVEQAALRYRAQWRDRGH